MPARQGAPPCAAERRHRSGTTGERDQPKRAATLAQSWIRCWNLSTRPGARTQHQRSSRWYGAREAGRPAVAGRPARWRTTRASILSKRSRTGCASANPHRRVFLDREGHRDGGRRGHFADDHQLCARKLGSVADWRHQRRTRRRRWRPQAGRPQRRPWPRFGRKYVNQSALREVRLGRALVLAKEIPEAARVLGSAARHADLSPG